MTTNLRHKIALFADSTCDIPEALVERYGISILPAYVIWGDEQYRDRIDLEPEAFYERLETDPVYPSSSHPTPEDFLNAFERARSEGAEAVVVVTVSSAMSGTYNAAQQVAAGLDWPVHIVDGKGPTMSLGWQVLAAARAREAAASDQAPEAVVTTMLDAAERARRNMAQLVYMEAIKYLHKGGRIGHAVSLIGSVLHIRPVIYIDHETGLVEVERAARTRKQGIEAMVQGFYSRLELDRPLHVAVLHGNVPDDAERLAQRVQEEIHPKELLINITGPVLGINTGPGALALCGYSEEE